MADPGLSSPVEVVPGTPGIKEIRFDQTIGPECSGQCDPSPGPSPRPGIRRVSLRAEIDTSPPFGSVKEAVTRFGGHGPWINPLYKYGDHNYNGEEEFDIKKVEEQTAELEKDLIVKELETLDVLEELTTTKRIVEELKRQLQKETLKCLNSVKQQQQQHQKLNLLISPQTKEMNRNAQTKPPKPEIMLSELKRARMGLGKTIIDLGAIQNSVESLTKKMRAEKEFIERTRDGVSGPSPEEEAPDNSAAVECLKRTAEMRWIAAKKMGEAAKAAEAVALAEITALGSTKPPQSFFSEPEKMSFNFQIRSPPTNSSGWSKKRLALADAMTRIDEAHASKTAIMRKLKEASEEVRLGKKAVQEALDRVDSAGKKQLAAEDALSRWLVRGPPPPAGDRRLVSDARHIDYRDVEGVDQYRKKKTTVSMRDVLSKKQVAGEEQNNNKVALSDMLQALRDDLSIFPTASKEEASVVVENPQKHRKRFGFIQISLPLTNSRKKKLSQQSI